MTKRDFMRNKKGTNTRSVKVRVIGLVCLCLFSIFFLNTAASAGPDKLATVSLKAKNQEVLQDEEVPLPEIEVTLKGDGTKVLDQNTGTTIDDVVATLQKGEGYEVKEEADTTVEGTYSIDVKLSKQYEEKVLKEWLGKLTINAGDGKLTVKNKYGQWDGKDKFKAWDGTQVVNSFVVTGGKTYYFGEDGVKVSGWADAGGKKYYFDKDGVMQTGWLTLDDKKYYLNEDGSMRIGWFEKDEKTKYYFGADGIMATGELQIGSKLCQFNKNGVLESYEDKLDPTKPMVALTFDDGPGKDTARLLDAFEQNEAHGTFFMQGKNVPNYKDVVKRMKDLGCELGNHSKNHPQLTKIGADAIKEQVGYTNQVIQEAAGSPATVLRPPYGAINDTVKQNVGMPMILWSVDTLDWKTKDKNQTVASILSAQDGDVILLHDIHSWSVDAAIEAIPQLIAKGYQLVTVSELAEAKGYTLEPGQKYSQFYKK